MMYVPNYYYFVEESDNESFVFRMTTTTTATTTQHRTRVFLFFIMFFPESMESCVNVIRYNNYCAQAKASEERFSLDDRRRKKE